MITVTHTYSEAVPLMKVTEALLKLPNAVKEISISGIPEITKQAQFTVAVLENTVTVDWSGSGVTEAKIKSTLSKLD